MRKRKRNIVRGTILAFFLVIVVGAMLIGCKKEEVLDEDTVLGYVNGIPIVYGEFDFTFKQMRAQIISESQQAYGITYGEGFWETEVNGKQTVSDKGKEIVLEELVKKKAQQEKFIEHEIAEDVSFESLLEYFEAENKERKEKVENGEVIYGMQEYTLDIYDTLLHDARLQLLKEWFMENNTPTDQDLEETYLELCEDGHLKASNTFEVLKISAATSKIDDVTKMREKIQTDGYKEAILIDGLSVEEITYESDSVGKMPDNSFQVTAALNAGECSEIIQNNEQAYFIYSVSRTEESNLTFEEAKSITVNYYNNNVFQSYLDELPTKVKLKKNNLNQVNLN